MQLPSESQVRLLSASLELPETVPHLVLMLPLQLSLVSASLELPEIVPHFVLTLPLQLSLVAASSSVRMVEADSSTAAPKLAQNPQLT